MATIDYEKKYKEALATARKLYNMRGDWTNLEIESIFPELRGSEDERIRKELISFFTERAKYTEDSTFNGLSSKEIIAWLEKQAQKTADIDNKFIKMRETKPKDISEFLDRLTTVEQEFLWEHIAKIRELDKEEQKPANWFQELEDKLANATPQQLAEWKEKYFKEEPAGWSKEDDEKLKWLCRIIHSCKVRKEISLAEESEIGSWVDKWLNYAPQSHWKPSDEQMSALSKAIAFVFDSNSDVKHSLESLYNELKKL